MKIFIVRHGETDRNKNHIVQGRADVPLNDTGRKQALAIAPYLKGKHFDALITSNLSRSIETGDILSKTCFMKQKRIDERLIERDLGVIDGLTIEQRHRLYPDKENVPGREPIQAVQQRMLSALHEYASQYENDILVVGHGNAILCLLQALDDAYLGMNMQIQNCAFIILDEKLNILAYNVMGKEIDRWLSSV